MDLNSLILPLLIVLLAVPLFLQARKQKRAMAEQQKLQNSIAPGDRVMTTSGVFGTVVATSDDTIDLELAPGMTTTWVRQAVREKVNTESAPEVAEVKDETPAEPETESKAEVAAPIEQQKTN
ncbi:preprotein translocase subunit YajC [Saccharopolyspora antimicrobica]|uniref:Preprotein translocase subunit YajC n=2 Tax=Saccharopolyspora TaxID=1835 RepID=A0A1I5BCD0_9PSEU|nr:MULTISPECIES: preprotein translocase subunit YajC [Saccharopolyspora]RKT86552.1 preprotein translocase subunit YajC [Saccharopolyspora antimicrobica]SEG70774.1 preprotein translocase subunit YajC [Saccharopolyspora kobensis]SFC35934.1 preprotein translocase subunit YajC [Saccharopolyspora kobensis]SFN72337.1 preprotein translocase subunit YajC [Saccharopolyspora antimicrobica]